MNRFPLPLNVSLNEGERDEWTLLSPFQHIDPDLGLITVPEGYTTNFASVPRIPIIFDLVGAYGHSAAVVHDYLSDHPRKAITKKMGKQTITSTAGNVNPSGLNFSIFTSIRRGIYDNIRQSF